MGIYIYISWSGTFVSPYIGNVIIPTDELHHFVGIPPTSILIYAYIVWAFQGQIPSVGMDWDHHQTSRHDPSSASARCHGALVRRAARAACATPRGGWAEAAWFGALELMQIAQLKKPHNIMKIRRLSDSTTNRMEFYNTTNLWLTWLASQQAIPEFIVPFESYILQVMHASGVPR